MSIKGGQSEAISISFAAFFSHFVKSLSTHRWSNLLFCSSLSLSLQIHAPFFSLFFLLFKRPVVSVAHYRPLGVFSTSRGPRFSFHRCGVDARRLSHSVSSITSPFRPAGTRVPVIKISCLGYDGRTFNFSTNGVSGPTRTLHNIEKEVW